ncbi:MAG: aconitase X catalytic domain-containing protein [Gammaproteobacteria bacterium]|nr:aconitase X catalytic domain-containing protein [Gammaproteobacteria bacterium]
MKLRDDEKAMLAGDYGPARQKAMALLVRYAEALGVERFVDTTNVAGVPGSITPFLHQYYGAYGSDYNTIFSLFDLDADEVVEVPRVSGHSCMLQGGIDPENFEVLGKTAEALALDQAGEQGAAARDIEVLRTCTPYLVGNVPGRGEHCAWMESSAVVYCNSVLAGRTNTEGRESTSAAMLTGKIPDFGFHRDEYRFGTHLIKVETPVETILDWGMLGYFTGQCVGEKIPVLTGSIGKPQVILHKHFGAAAASSGGVEMYHMVGLTPEAATEEMAFGPGRPKEVFVYDAAARQRIYDDLNANGRSRDVDFVMLGCPHAALEQIEEACRLLDGRRLSENTQLWIFTSRVVRAQAQAKGYAQRIIAAGGHIITDTCSAIGQAIPPGTKVAALDSAKQVHYLPAIMNIEAWFGSTADCINAALTGRWQGELV